MTKSIPSSMTAIEIPTPGGPDALVVGSRAVPQPGDEVLVGFSEENTALCELITSHNSRIIIRAMHDRRQLHELEPGNLLFMHRVVAVIRPDTLSSKTSGNQK